jgi:hypothetical protein
MNINREELVQETIELIKVSGYVVADQLIFEPWSERAMQIVDGFEPGGVSLQQKMPQETEETLIDCAYKDQHVWQMVKTYVLQMVADAEEMSQSANHFYELILDGYVPEWPAKKKINFFRDDLICTLIQYLIKRHNLRVNPVFGENRNAQIIILTAFKRLQFADNGTVKSYAKIWERNSKRSKYSKNYFMHRAARLAYQLEESGWIYQPPIDVSNVNQSFTSIEVSAE